MKNTLLGLALLTSLAPTAEAAIDYPIAFVTQAPIGFDFCTINATFCNHSSAINISGRGGDLWMRYPDGSLKNLTAAAGFGQVGLQGNKYLCKINLTF